MSLGRYALVVVGSLAASQAGAWLALGDRLTPLGLWAVLTGGGLAAINTLAAYGLVLWSQPRSTRTFFAAVLGGMLGRMALLLAALVAGVLVVGLPRVPLALSLLAYFAAFLVFELTLLQRRASLARVPR